MATVVERRIIRFGDGGLAITIPKAWADYYGLKPGDRVEVVTNAKLIVYIRGVGRSLGRAAGRRSHDD